MGKPKYPAHGIQSCTQVADKRVDTIEQYDKGAAATGWYGPAVVFGLAFPYTRPGQTILDIGIGTGLGSELFHTAGIHVIGIDISEEMLDACRKKGFADRLVCHDLTMTPYPFGDASFDHAVSTGVFQFFENLTPVFREISRILRDGGVFVFVTVDRRPKGDATVVVGPEYTGTGSPVTMYCHTLHEVNGWLEKCGFYLVDTLEFTVWMDAERSKRLPARAYLAQKKSEGQ
jgi:predicted TPR repeat methyltransferase